MKICSLILLMFMPYFVSCAEEVFLVRDGRPLAAIVLAEKATRSAQMGAYELQAHVSLITGAKMPIVRGTLPEGIPTAIKIGGLESEFQEETSVIRFRPGEILLAGGDTADYSTVDYAKPSTFPPVNYHWKGSLFAVYDFLEDYCDVHFYGATPEMTTFQPRPDLSVPVRNQSHTSPMDAFRDFFDDIRGQCSGREMALWKLRWRASVTYAQVNHNTYSIYFAHWDKAKDERLANAFQGKRPELFAQGYAGKAASCGAFLEKRYPNDPDLPPQLCYSNPETADYYAREALAYYQSHNVLGGWMNKFGELPPDLSLMPRFPGKPYYYPYEGNDNGSYCKCDSCRAIVANGGDSLLKFDFISKASRRAAELSGTSELGFATLGYGSSLPCPDNLDLPANTSVELCLTTYAWWHPEIRRRGLDNFDKWVAAMNGKGPLTLWLYIYGPYHDAKAHYGNYQTFPLLYPWKTAELMQRFAKSGVRGVFAEIESPVNRLESYVTMRLAYNPALDPTAVIDSYFRNCFGEAGPVMSQFYHEIESAAYDDDFLPKEMRGKPGEVLGLDGRHVSPWWPTKLWTRDLNWRLGSHERMERLETLVKKAQGLVRTQGEKARLEKFLADVWNPAVAGRRDHDLYLRHKEIPPRTLTLAPVLAADGDPAIIDWTKAVCTEDWLGIDGKPNGSTASLQAASDGKFLYLRFHEDRVPLLDRGVWTENIEFFFTADGRHPLYHFAHGPKAGSLPTGLCYQVVNDVLRTHEYDFEAKTISVPTESDWTLLVSIPLKKLPLIGNTMRVDFFRMRLGNESWEVSCWQPTYSLTGKNGMDSFGTLFLLPFTVQQDQFKLLCRGAGTELSKDSKATDGWAATQTGRLAWYLSYPIPKCFPKLPLRIVLRYRVDAPKVDYVTTGVYDFKNKRSILAARIPGEVARSSEYHDFPIGTCELREGMNIYIGAIMHQGKRLMNGTDVSFLDSIRFESHVP